ncbi:MAG: hypothetical protein CO129_08335 [Ignavibacteriales bacterium CG_4_9_14_3_um_filter_34_10]|nr:MAG: hypothetical protein CO129_08335 [Ignavibacteriales bacterium CG_4_9_14_3_um_filter_34_10]
MMNILKFFLLLIIIVNVLSCNKLNPSEQAYYDKITAARIEKDNYMKDNPDSPFNHKSKVDFHNLNYFDVNPDLRFRSKLFENEIKDIVTIYGTKGEPRETVRFGYVKINFKNQSYKLNVYESEYSKQKFYSIWFTDRTTNNESYGVGRYLDFEIDSDKDFIYDIDFNLAYNPYCAYTAEYSCAIPTKEDHIDLEINAGEKIFHK